MGAEIVAAGYYTMYVTAVINVLFLREPHGWYRFGISASLLVLSVPAVFLWFGVLSFKLRAADIICDGFFMDVLAGDVTLAKMAGWEIHTWFVLMSTVAVLYHTTILAMIIVYYIAVFGDICFYLNMPLMTVF